MSFVFFSPASEQAAANSVIQIESVDVCTIAYDAYVIPLPVDPPPLFTYGPPFDTGNTSNVTIRNSTVGIATNAPVSPSDTQVGDLVIVFHWTRGTVGVPTHTLNVAGDFREIGTQAHDDGSTDGRLSVAYKMATSAGAVAYNAYTSNTGTDYAGIVVLQKDTFNVTQSIVVNSSSDPGTGAADPPAITTPTDRCLVFAVAGYHNPTATFLLSPPASYSEVWEMAGALDADLSVATRMVSTAGVENPGAWTDNGTPNGTCAMTFAIRPPNRFQGVSQPSLLGPSTVLWGPWPHLMDAKFSFSARHVDVVQLSAAPSFITFALQEGSAPIYTISFFEDDSNHKTYGQIITDNIVVTEQLQVQGGILVTDQISLTDQLTNTRTLERLGTDSIPVTDSTDVETTKSKIVNIQEAISIPDFILNQAFFARTLGDTVSVTDTISRGRENFKDFSETISMVESSSIETFTPASIGTLLVWFDSQNNVTGTNPISSIGQRTGAPAGVTYTAVNAPVLTSNVFGTKPSIRMLADSFDPGGILGGQPTHTIIITFKTTDSVTAGSGGVGMVLLESANNTFTIGLEGGTLRYRYWNGSTFTNYDTSVTNLNDGNVHTIGVRNTGFVAFMSVDSTATVGGGTTGASGTILLPPRYFGGKTGSVPVSNPFKGDLAEVLGYSGFISGTDYQRLFDYSLARWH